MSTCQDTHGFLFKHPCTHPASGNCSVCGKAICHQHVRLVEGEACCIACSKRGTSSRRADDDYHDPYYYGPRYYRGYGYYGYGHWGHDHHQSAHGHDPNDFTEGDAEALGEEGDADFESDMGAS